VTGDFTPRGGLESRMIASFTKKASKTSSRRG